jgi:hypothetical protein
MFWRRRREPEQFRDVPKVAQRKRAFMAGYRAALRGRSTAPVDLLRNRYLIGDLLRGWGTGWQETMAREMLR